jgi:O-Antigen ligase
MSHKTVDLDRDIKTRGVMTLQPTNVWIGILGFIFFTMFGIFVGGGAIRIGFPVLSLAVGIFLYRKSSTLYVSFTWWIWLLTPLIARLVDLRSGWDPQRLILVSPFLVTFVSIATLFRYLPVAYLEGGFPYIVALTGISYGTLIGLMNNSPINVARALLDWLSPLLLSFHLFANWRTYPEHRKNIQKTFLWGVLITGAYGIFQYIIAPEWDRFWLIESGLITSAGKPEPLGIRVWSTMHSPGPFGHFMMVGLLLLFSHQSPLQIPAVGVGYLAFLLSLVRSAWLAWVLGLLSLIASLKPKLQMRLILSIFVLGICILPLTTIEPFSSTISNRVQSISNLDEDQSFNDRSGNYETNFTQSLINVLGDGIGGNWEESNGSLEQIARDSGIIDTFLTLGLLGGIPYLTGMILMLSRITKSPQLRVDPFMSAAYATCLGSFLQLIFTTSTIGLPGMLLWSFLGISMAAHNYHNFE